jgi:hypothetical protein
MTNQELTAFIKLLLDCGKALVQLAEHLDSLNLDFLSSENSSHENLNHENSVSKNQIATISDIENFNSENKISTISDQKNFNSENTAENQTNIAKISNISEKTGIANGYEKKISNSDISANEAKISQISVKNENSNINDNIIISDNKNVSETKTTSEPNQAQIFNSNNAPFAKLFAGLATNQNQNKQLSFNPLQMLNKLTNIGNLGSGGQNGANPLGNLANLGGLANLGNLAGLGSKPLPTTLAELHDNPQLLGMLNNVAENPQMLNMLATLTGQDAKTLQSALQSLQPAAAVSDNVTETAEITESAAAPSPTQAQTASAAADILRTNPTVNTGNLLTSLMQLSQPNMTNMSNMANMANLQQAPIQNMPQTPTAHLDSLLAEWHWQPYARAWIS